MKTAYYFPKKILTSLIGILSISLLPETASAQIGSASVHGVIVAQSQPQAGLEVQAKNIDNGYSFRAVTQKDGTYIFKGLAPGKYHILLPGKSDKALEVLILKVGQSAALNFELDKPVDAVEEIVVIGSQLKSVSNGGEIGTSVSLAQINKLPQTTRNFLAFADLAPGVQFQQLQDGSTSIKSGAQNASAVNVFIDGVGQKDYVLKGGVSGQDTSRGNPFPQSAIGEYKIITQNYSAEYDQISSAAIVAVTASGTNEFHGGVFYDFSDEGMRKMTLSELENNKKIPSEQKQYGIHVGGPIIQDKVHFFFAYEGKNNADPKDVLPGGGISTSNLPAALQAEIGGRTATFKEDLYFGKIDYLMTEEQKFGLAVKIRRETELTSIGGANTLSYGTDKKNDETRVDLSHNWRTDNWLNDFHFIWEDAAYNLRPHTSGIGIIYKNSASNWDTVLNTGAGPDYQEKSQKGWGLQEDFTYTAISDHVIKTGFKFKVIDLVAAEQQPYSPQFEYNINYLDAPALVRWGAPLSTIGNGSAEANNKQYGVYVQDDWSATDRLTISAGVRWDYEKSDNFLNYKTPDDVVAALQGWSNLQNSDIDINDYISSGDNRKAFKNAWQPRVGFTYNLTEDTDTVMFGGIGRAYDRNLFDHLQVETTKATFPTQTMTFINGDTTANNRSCTVVSSACVPWDPIYLTPEGLNQLLNSSVGLNREVDLINNKLKTPYSDQFSLGVRGSLNEDWKAEVSLSRIISKDGFAWLLGNRRADGGFFEPGKNWGSPWGDGIPGFGSLLIGVNGIESKTNSLFIKLEKPKQDSPWGATIAYTYSDSTSNRKAGEIYSFDYPTVDAYGVRPSTDLPRERLVIAGLTDLPMGIDFSAKLNLQTRETFYGTDCMAGPNVCVYRDFKPDTLGFLGYRQLDIAFSKTIDTGTWMQASNLTLRLDVLNLTNAVNHEGVQDWIGGYDAAANNNAGAATPNPDFQKPTNSLAGPTRTVKLGIKWDW